MRDNPAKYWRYRRDARGDLESRLFLDKPVPENEGWRLTPTLAGFPHLDKAVPEPIEEDPVTETDLALELASQPEVDMAPKRRRGRPPKVKPADE